MSIQVGTTYRTAGQIGPIVVAAGDIIAPGAMLKVLFSDHYFPSQVASWPVRGGEYRPGETASFPMQEAQAIVAAGIGSLA